jgi:hypothetical protein
MNPLGKMNATYQRRGEWEDGGVKGNLEAADGMAFPPRFRRTNSGKCVSAVPNWSAGPVGGPPRGAESWATTLHAAVGYARRERGAQYCTSVSYR